MNLQYLQIDRSFMTKAKIVALQLGVDAPTVLGWAANLWWHAADLADLKQPEPEVFKTKDPARWVLHACDATGWVKSDESDTFARRLCDALRDVTVIELRTNAVRIPGLPRYFDVEKNRDATREKAKERTRKWRESLKSNQNGDGSVTRDRTSRDAPRSDQIITDQIIVLNTPKKRAARKPKPATETEKPISKYVEARDALEATFLSIKNVKYPFDGGRDGKAISELLKIYPGAEPAFLGQAFGRALHSKFPTVQTIHEFKNNLAHFVGTKPVDVRRGVVNAEDMGWDKTGGTNDVADF